MSGATQALEGETRPGPEAAGRRLKILYHHRTASKDGQAVHIVELTDALRRLGHEIVFVGPGLGRDEGFGGESKLVARLRALLPRALFELLELSYSALAYLRLARAYRAHRPDVLYERFNLFLLAGSLLRRRTGLPYLLEINAPLYDERTAFGGLSLRGLAHLTQKKAWQAADRALPVTGVLAEYLRRDGVAEDRIAVVPNGIDPAAFLGPADRAAAKARLGLQDHLVMGFTGFIREWHGLESVIELLADKRSPARIKFLVVGDGPGRAALAARAERLGVAERVHFAGLVEREAIPGMVSAFDIALQPSATRYASPLKIFEYMALGCAIVAPRQANIEEILSDGESALLFDPEDPTSMRERIGQVCEDAALRQRLGEAARRVVVERDLTWDGNARRIEAMAWSELARRRSPGGA